MSYVSRVLRLTLLAPDIVKAILNGRQPAGLQLQDVLNGLPDCIVEARGTRQRQAALLSYHSSTEEKADVGCTCNGDHVHFVEEL